LATCEPFPLPTCLAICTFHSACLFCNLDFPPCLLVWPPVRFSLLPACSATCALFTLPDWWPSVHLSPYLFVWSPVHFSLHLLSSALVILLVLGMCSFHFYCFFLQPVRVSQLLMAMLLPQVLPSGLPQTLSLLI